MRQRLSTVLLLAVGALAATAPGARSSAATRPLGPLPARGIAVATPTATLFLDGEGRELARLPLSYALSRAPHGELLLSRGPGATFVLRPSTGALVPVAPRALLLGPAWTRRNGCSAAAVHRGTWYLTCRSGIVAVTPHGQRVTLAAQPARQEWVELSVSPDGKTLLANASRECDGRRAYVLPTAGGSPRSLVASDASYGAGWTASGDAVVWLPNGACSGDVARPGVYAIGLHGGRRLLAVGGRGAATWGA